MLSIFQHIVLCHFRNWGRRVYLLYFTAFDLMRTQPNPLVWVSKSKTDGRTKSMSFREVYCIYMYCSRCFKCCCCVVISFQRGGAYAVLIGGWSLGAYLIQWTWSNLKDLLLNHNQWVIGYLVVIGMSLKRPIDMRTRFN